MKPHLITASMAAKEALMALARFSMFGQAATLPLPHCIPLGGKDGQIWCGAAISPHDFENRLAALTEEEMANQGALEILMDHEFDFSAPAPFTSHQLADFMQQAGAGGFK